MPEVGETRIDYPKGVRRKLIWSKCGKCGVERWLRFYLDMPSLCHTCCRPKGENAYNWKGGRYTDYKGYIWRHLLTDNPFVAMANKRSRGTSYAILEHRLVMAQHLGRCLTKSECVHHLNGNKADNHIENLQLTTRKTHRLDYQSAYNDGMIEGLKVRDKSLEKQIKLLQWQIKEMRETLKLKLKL